MSDMYGQAEPLQLSFDTVEPPRPALTPTQNDVFDRLLCVGGPRPLHQLGIVDELRTLIDEGTRDALRSWSEPGFFLGKSSYTAMFKCEQMAVLSTAGQPSTLPFPTAVGIVTHRAIQMSSTHSGRPPVELVRLAVAGSMTEEQFAAFYGNADEWRRSELETEAVNRLVTFLDSFPPLEPQWTPRFEMPFSVKFDNGLSMSGRPDLVLGRPRTDGSQTMFLCDFKSGDIRPEHHAEAHFYALLATLRNGVPPFRSCVYSLASGSWTDPDVTEDTLRHTASQIVDAVNRRIQLLIETRPAERTPGKYCTWCPELATCPQADPTAVRPVNVTPPPVAARTAPIRIPSENIVADHQPALRAETGNDNPWLLD